ncbi:MAG: polysaccharide deacetylase family protein [Nitrospirota bacterium]
MRSLKQLLKCLLIRLLPLQFVMWRGRDASGRIALTFDDGPDPELTPAILAVLRQYGVKATFFVLGEKARTHPELIELIARDGHEIGNHSFSHQPMNESTLPSMIREFSATDRLIHHHTGRPAPLIRPPRGIMTLPFLWYALTHRRTVVLWSVDPQDYHPQASELLLERILQQLGSSSDIVLLHERHRQTVELLPPLLDVLTARRAQCVTVSRLMEAA